jgi:hypothetical protein
MVLPMLESSVLFGVIKPGADVANVLFIMRLTNYYSRLYE